MKRCFYCMLALLLCSCVQEVDMLPEQSDLFLGNMEDLARSKTMADLSNRVLWTNDDQLVIFEKSASAAKYRLQDSYAGKRYGAFELVAGGQSSGNPISHNVAFYPYSEHLQCMETSGEEYIISGIELPQIQKYVKNSFSEDSFPMVAVSSDRNLNFFNVLGGLKLQLQGDCTVRKITVEGNNGEALSGKAQVMSYADGSEPEITMLDSKGGSVVLDCGETGAVLNGMMPTLFIISLPPVEFSEGFTVTITDMEGAEKVLKAARGSVYRSSLLRMPLVSMNGDDMPGMNQMLTLEEVYYDGFRMNVKVPETVKNSTPGQPGSRALRYQHADLLSYNSKKRDSDDYFKLLYNGGRCVLDDEVLEIDESHNWGNVGMDVNEDGLIDENDCGHLWDPIAPGEPIVFMVGEFEWMSEPDEYKPGGVNSGELYEVNGFYFPAGWEDGYYLPCVDAERYWNYYDDLDNAAGGTIPDTDAFWMGAFQRKIFRSRMPDKLDADFEITHVDAGSANEGILISPDEGIYQYFVLVLDDATYVSMLECLDGNEDYLQWMVTSYTAAYGFGSIHVTAEMGCTSAQSSHIRLSDVFYAVPNNTTFHVLVTGMSGEVGSPQCFRHYTFFRHVDEVRINIENAITTKSSQVPVTTTFDAALEGDVIFVNGKYYTMSYDGQLYAMVEQADSYVLGYPSSMFKWNDDTYSIIYPTCYGTSNSLWYPTIQVPYAGICMPGESQCEMEPMCALMKVEFAQPESSTRLEFCGKGVSVCGEVRYFKGTLTQESLIGGSDVVTVYDSCGELYLPIPPTTLINGLSIGLYDSVGQELFYRSSQNTMQLKRANQYVMQIK